MIQVYRPVTIVSLIAALLLSVSACTSLDESNPSAFQPERNSQGHPNIQGIWDFRTLTPLERPESVEDKSVFSEEEAEAFRQAAVDRNDVDTKRAAPAVYDVEGAYNSVWYDFGTEMNEDRRTSLIVDPANGRLPDVTPEAMARMKKGHLRTLPVRDFFSYGTDPVNYRPAGPETLGLSERCLVGFNAGPPLSPSAYNNNLRIIQAPNHIVLVTEMIHDARIVLMDGRPHLPAELRKWTGDSRGHWDGDTLVVETRNFTDKTPTYQMPVKLDALDESGPVGLGSNLNLVERFTLISASRLVYEYTIDAPASFTKPFTVAIPMRLSDEQMYEYACHEGNYALPGILKGARIQEKEDAT